MSASRWCACVGWLLCMAAPLWAQRSPFNERVVPAPDSTGHYRFLMGGHFHGSSTNRSGFPASSLLANLDSINGLGGHILLSTGDLFMDPRPEGDPVRYAWSFFQRLRMPLFNAPGNHDVYKGMPKGEGHAPFHFVVARTAVILLDTERNNGDLDARDEALLDSARIAAGTGRVDRVLILSHRPVWAEGDARYGPLFEGNTRSVLGNNFGRVAMPWLERITAHVPVFWISGSMAGRAPASIFFQPHAHHLTFIQCAIRDEPRDALLILDVGPDGHRWSAYSLTGRPVMVPERYDAAWWEQHQRKGEPFNWRLLPHRVMSTLRHPAFLWGLAAGALLLFTVRRLFKGGH